LLAPKIYRLNFTEHLKNFLLAKKSRSSRLKNQINFVGKLVTGEACIFRRRKPRAKVKRKVN